MPRGKVKPRKRAMAAAAQVLAGELSQSEAARHHGVSRQAVHRALERLKKRPAMIAGQGKDGMIIRDEVIGWGKDQP